MEEGKDVNDVYKNDEKKKKRKNDEMIEKMM